MFSQSTLHLHLLFISTSANSISFNFFSFNSNVVNITFQGDAHSLPEGLQLTRDSGYENNTLVLVVPYIMNKCTFGITAQGGLRTSKLNSPLTSNLFMRFLVMDSPSLLHHLVRTSLRIEMVGILD